jgi:hypothetical protein
MLRRKKRKISSCMMRFCPARKTRNHDEMDQSNIEMESNGSVKARWKNN